MTWLKYIYYHRLIQEDNDSSLIESSKSEFKNAFYITIMFLIITIFKFL